MADQFLTCFFLLLTFVQQASAACRIADNAPENGYFINRNGEKRTDRIVQKAGDVQIECNQGYYLRGPYFRECLLVDGKKKWGELESQCVDKNECLEGVLPDDTSGDDDAAGGSFDGSSFSFSSSQSSNAEPKLVPACHRDAKCTNLQGSYKCECNECFIGDGKQCIADLTPCHELNEVLENGRIYKTNGGNKIEYVCDKDYRSTGITHRFCKCGTWYPDAEPTSCKFQGCLKPTDPENGKVIYSSLLYGNRAIYQCDVNFVIHGPGERTCRTSGEWSYYEPLCKPAETFVDVAAKFKESFIDKVGSYSNTSAAGGALEGRLAANAVGLDIVFAFDASSSISYNDFKYGVDFANLLVDQFGVSYEEGGTRIAAIVFASGARIKFNFNDEDANDVEEVQAKITEIQQELGGGTAMREAFELIIGDVIPEMRINAKRALFMMTDGESNDGNPAAAATRLREIEDVEIFSVGIGAQVERDELKSIASAPYTSHVFLIKSFSDLQILSEVISEKRVDFNRCGVAIDMDVKEAKKNEATRGDNYDVVVPNTWPWVASVSRKFKNTDYFRHTCGGTLICKDWVLTAASCVNRNSNPSRSNEIMVTFGQHNRSSDAEIEVQEREVEKIILADGFIKNTFGKDLALLKLKTPVVLASFVRTACLGDNEDDIQKTFADCYTVGWGAKGPTDQEDYLDIPQQLRMPVKLEEDCRSTHEAEYGENITCAGYRASGMSACVGDTGGALVCLRHDDTWAVIGVAVPNSECDKNGKYGLYTKPLKFTEWINSNTGNCLDEHRNIFN